MEQTKNIIITGFMGTGKTTVGREVARILAREFYDTDEIIEARAGMCITDVFNLHGEPSFRQMESAVMAELVRSDHTVIATGGGTLLNDGIADLALKTGIIFCLNADLPSLAARLRLSINRPLLRGRDTFQSLLQQREKSYRQLPNQIDTTHLSPHEVASAIIDEYRQLTGDVASRA